MMVHRDGTMVMDVVSTSDNGSGIGVGIGVGVAMGVGDAVGVGRGVDVAVGDGVSVGAGVAVAVDVAVGVLVASAVAVAVAVCSSVAVGAGLGVGVGAAAGVGVLVVQEAKMAADRVATKAALMQARAVRVPPPLLVLVCCATVCRWSAGPRCQLWVAVTVLWKPVRMWLLSQ